MKKIRKFGILAACLVAAVSFGQVFGVFAATEVAVPTAFGDAVEIDVSSENEALNHWQYYISGTLDEQGNQRGKVTEDKNVIFGATANGKTGNALYVGKKTQNGSVTAYPYAIEIAAEQTYAVTAYVKTVCEQAEENAISFSVTELDKNGAQIAGSDGAKILSEITGSVSDWTKVEFFFTASKSAVKIVPMVEFKGKGDFYLDDMAVRTATVYSNTVSYRLQSIGKLADGATDDISNIDGSKAGIIGMKTLTAANISPDSSDGDGASLQINDGEVFKTNFLALSPDKTYRFSFKYKHIKIGSKNTLSIRFDYMTLAGARMYYIDVINGSATEWLTCSVDVKGVAGGASHGVAITANARYLIDELSIVCLDDGDTMQYIANGSFSGAYTSGYTLGANANVAVQPDGTGVFAAGNGVFDDTVGQRGFIKYVPAGLTAGKTYTLGFDYRFAGDDYLNAVLLYHNGAEKISIKASDIPYGWTNKTYTFTAKGNDEFMFYGPSYYLFVTYYRNITITDADGKQYNSNLNLVKPQTVFGENILNNGAFDGNAEYVSSDWSFSGNAGIYGLSADNGFVGNPLTDTGSAYKLCLDGTTETPAYAIGKEITALKRTLAVALTCYNGDIKDLVVSAVAGDTEIVADENGFIELPQGVTKVKLKFSSQKYVAIGNISAAFHTHATPNEGDIRALDATCTVAGGKVYTCADCKKTVYLEKTALKAHELEHVHIDATCVAGVDKDVCKVCKGEFNVEILPEIAGTHKFDEVVLADATCVKIGRKLNICEYCGGVKDRTIVPATGKHNYKNGVCADCGASDPDYIEPSDSGAENSSANGCKSSVGGGIIGFGFLAAAVITLARRRG